MTPQFQWVIQHDVDYLEMLENYCGTRRYKSIQQMLREGESSISEKIRSDVKRTVDSMDRVISSSTLHRSIEVTRTIRDVPESMVVFLRGKSDEYTDAGFMSCSTVAGHFFESDANAILRITIPPGKGRGIHAQAAEELLPSHYRMKDGKLQKSENEYIIGRGSTLRVTRRRPGKNGIIELWMELS